jgi:hypothetical protein
VLDCCGFRDGLVNVVVLDAFHNGDLGLVFPRNQIAVLAQRGEYVVENLVLAVLHIGLAVIIEKILCTRVIEIVVVKHERLDKRILFCSQILHSLCALHVIALNVFKRRRELVANIIMDFGFHIRIGFVFVVNLRDFFQNFV